MKVKGQTALEHKDTLEDIRLKRFYGHMNTMDKDRIISFEDIGEDKRKYGNQEGC